MTITRYFQRSLSLFTTARPLGLEIDKETYDCRISLFGNRPDFAYISEHEEDIRGDKVSFKMTTYATQTPAVVQFIEVTGEEEAVQEEAEYICHI